MLRPGAAVVLAAILLVAPRLAHADRPTTLAMGLSGVAEGRGGASVLALPASIEVATAAHGQLWWRAGASFGVASMTDDGDGHVFSLRTGPHVQHCGAPTWCIGASVELGWGHARWNFTDRDQPLTLDDVHVEARLRAAFALTPRVLVEASAGPRLRLPVRAADMSGPVALDTGPAPLSSSATRGGTIGLALVVRN